MLSAVEIREAVLKDAKAIAELNNRQMGYKISPEETSERLASILASKSHKVFVAAVDGNVVGYIHANDYDVLYFPHMKNILGIAVNEEFKRQGIGRRLMDATEVWARNTNAVGIRLVSGSERKDAHAFYTHCGYKENKEQLNFKKIFD